RDRFGAAVESADAVIVGSYVPDGAELLNWVLASARGVRLFYDIDTPVTLEKLRRDEPTYIGRESIPKLDGYLSFTGGPVLETIAQIFGAPLVLPLYCSVDTELYAPVARAPARDLGYLGTYSADRQPALEKLLVQSARAWTSGRFVVAGSCYPHSDWPPNVERLEHVPPGEHRQFYGSLRFALNLTRADMLKAGFSPSVRLFEAAACGVPVVSDVWAGMDEFFAPGREIAQVRSSLELLQVLTRMPEADRMRMGQRARERVLRQHTAEHRARQLEHYLAELRDSKRPSLLSAKRREALRQRCVHDNHACLDRPARVNNP
ncbi:MAG TPA: glycosyltransferase, partial [Polyangiaceae bacterium]